MKRILIGSLLALTSAAAFAEAPGGPSCGWGNMLFKGQRGMASHFVASTTNGTSGNATFGITSGTNGCDTSGALGYNGRSMLAMNGMLESIAEDMAQGQGEALDAYATLLGIETQDRAHFALVTQQHFCEIFSSQGATGDQVLAATLEVMSRDAKLARYTRQPA